MHRRAVRVSSRLVMEGGSVMEEQLSMHCRRWLLQADNLVLALERQQQLASTAKASSTATARAAGRPVNLSRSNGSTANGLFQLYQRGLQAACKAFIGFSELTQWHVAPDPAVAATLKLTTQVRTVSITTWWQIIDSGLLRRTADVLQLVRVPHTTTGCGRGEEGQPTHVLRVGTFHETILKACSIMISGISLAPLQLWRPLLEQLLEPRANGFVLLLVDVLGALVQVAPHKPLLFHPPTEGQTTEYPKQRMSVRLDLTQHANEQSPSNTTTASRSLLAKSSQPGPEDALPAALTPAAITSDSLARSNNNASGLQGEPVGEHLLPLPQGSLQMAFRGFGVLPVADGVGLSEPLFASMALHQLPTDEAPAAAQSNGNAAHPGPRPRDPSFSGSALAASGALRSVPRQSAPAQAQISEAHRQPAIPMLELAGISPGDVYPTRLKARPGTVLMPLTTNTDSDTEEGEGPYVSRHAALAALEVLRDVNELASQEMSLRRGSAGSLTGLPTIRIFLESLVDLRAGVAGALNHLGVLGHLATMYRTSADLCMSREELFPVLEGIVAIACHASSPDLAGPGANGRQGQRQGDVRLYASALQPDVLSLVTDELHQAMSGVSAQVRARTGEAFHQLPRGLQAQLSLLRHLCDCLIILGAAPLPPHHIAHASEMLSGRASPDGPDSPTVAARPTSGNPGNTSRSSTLCRKSIVRTASRSSLKLNASKGSTEDAGAGDPRYDAASPLLMIVRDVLAAVRLFCSFAACDVPFFCTAADSWLPTVKALARRLASEGHTDLVELVTLTLCEAAAAMTTAMRMAAGTAAEADKTVQTKIADRLAKQMAGGLLLDHSVEAEVHLRLMRRRGHPDRPFGWGAGASAGGLSQAAVAMSTSVCSSTPRHDKSDYSPRAGNAVSPRMALLGLDDDDVLQQQGSISSVGHASPGSSVRTPCGGVAALLPMSPQRRGSSHHSTSTSQMATPRSPFADMESSPLRTDRGSPQRKPERKSELAALWAALGYNSNGVPLDAVATGADVDEIDAQLLAWGGLPKHYVVHCEEILRAVLQAILHLLRGYLLPIKWRSLPWEVAVQLSNASTTTKVTTPGNNPVSPFSAFISTPKQTQSGSMNAPMSPGLCRGAEAGDVPPATPSAATNQEQRGSSAHRRVVGSGPVPPIISLALGSRLFKSGAATALEEGDTMGDVPQSVTNLMESLSRAGLLACLEGLFNIELMTDQMYTDHLAAVDTHMLELRAKGGSSAQIDRCRVTAIQLMRDVFGSAPQMVSDRQGVHLLHALKKFMSCKLLTASSSPVLSHPLARFTCYPPLFELPSGLEVLSSNALQTRPSDQLFSAPWSPVMHAPGEVTNSAARHSKAREAGAAHLTTYCTSSLVALALELLPLPRIAAARAAADLAPGPTPGSAWVPSPLKVLGSSILLVHTWPQFLLLLKTLMRTLDLDDAKPRTKPLLHDATGSMLSRKDQPSSMSHVPSRSSISMLQRNPPENSTAAGISSKSQGRDGKVARRTRSLAPLHRLLEAWIQQMNQLLQRYSHMESLRSCLDMSLLHGGVASLLLELVSGQHFTLATRARKQPANAGVTPDMCLGGFHSTLGQNAASNMTPTASSPAHDQALTLVGRQREIDREYGLSGMALVSLEELLCLTHELCTPTLSTQLVVSGLIRSLEEATAAVHNRNVVVVSMLRVIAATHLLTVENADTEPGSPALCSPTATSPHKRKSRPNSASSPTGPKQPLARSPGSIGAFTATDMARIRSQTIMLAADTNRLRTVNFSSEAAQDEDHEQLMLKDEGTEEESGLLQAEERTLTKSRQNSSRRRLVRKSSAWSEAALSMIHRDREVEADQEASLDLAMPRAGHWLLMASSMVKRATCGVSIAAAQLASMKLSTGAIGAKAERYTTGANPAAATNSAVPAARQRLRSTSGAGEPEASGTGHCRPSTSSLGSQASDSGSEAVADEQATTTGQTRRRSHRKPDKRASKASVPNVLESSQALSTLGAAQQAAARTLEQLSGQQPTALLQHCRQLLIACKNSGVGQELLAMLTALPLILEPASQLRTMQVTLRTMNTSAQRTALGQGIEIAAAAVAVLDRAADGRRWSAHQRTSNEQDNCAPVMSTKPVQAVRSPMMTRHAAKAQTLDSADQDKANGDTPTGDCSGSRQRPSLSVQIPAAADSSDGAQGTGTPTTTLGPAAKRVGAGDHVSVSQGWEAHASVMVVDEPPDNLWMEQERLKLQKTHLQKVLDALDGTTLVLMDAPIPELNTATPALSERPHLLGCSNTYCLNVVPGRPEREVVLKRCDLCQRVWYCCEACRLAARPQHKPFCHWSAALL